METDVSVLGCGLMGAALASTLATSGRRVTVWNRTPARAQALAGPGVTPVSTAVEAVESSPVVLACMSSYSTTRECLDAVDGRGRALINLCTGTPDDAQSMTGWAADHGFAYLDGAIICFPERVGAPDALFAYAGSQALWEQHSPLLLTLGGGSRFLSEQVGAANVLDTAIIGSFYVSAVGAYVEAASYAHAQGVPAPMMREATRLVLRTLGHSTKVAAAEIESGDHATTQATLATYAAGSRSTLKAMREAGHHARLLGAAVENLEAACEAGLGHLGIYAQTKITADGSSSSGSADGR